MHVSPSNKLSLVLILEVCFFVLRFGNYMKLSQICDVPVLISLLQSSYAPGLLEASALLVNYDIEIPILDISSNYLILMLDLGPWNVNASLTKIEMVKWNKQKRILLFETGTM